MLTEKAVCLQAAFFYEGTCAMLKLVFLTPQFYTDHAHFPEIEQKPIRPYARVQINVNGVLWALPLRSNITHGYAVFTDRANRCGIDFTKAVAVSSPAMYIDSNRRPYIRPNEHAVLKTVSEHHLVQRFLRYVSDYQDAKRHPNAQHNRMLLRFSTLQYFEDYL